MSLMLKKRKYSIAILNKSLNKIQTIHLSSYFHFDFEQINNIHISIKVISNYSNLSISE